MAYQLNYLELLPSNLLKPFIQCYWMMRLPFSLASRSHQVLPDGCMDILFDLESEKVEVIGTMTRSIEIELASGLDLCGIRFKPGGIYPFIQVDASEFTDEAVQAPGRLGQLIYKALDELKARRTNESRVDYLNSLLEKRLANCEKQDLLFLKFLSNISQGDRGISRVDQVLPMVGMSQRTLERYFQRHVGIGPKKFLSVLRLRRVLRELSKVGSLLDWADLALRHGYHDQAHLIHEFKGITGTTPTRFRLKDPTLSDFYNTATLPEW